MLECDKCICNKFLTFRISMCIGRNFKVLKEGCFFFMFADGSVYSQQHGDKEEH
jgi:hypothetical protein